MPAEPQPPTPTTPPALGRVLGVLRKLIDYGKQLVATVQQRAAAPNFAFFAKPFGTADIALILARITAGLRRAALLEAALCHRAARGRDLTTSSLRMPDTRRPRDRQTPPQSQPTGDAQDPRLARLPTEQEIAAELRRRPIGAVIADICLDLGITPGQLDRGFWDELAITIIAYGGSLASYYKTLTDRVLPISPACLAAIRRPAPLPRSPVPATGPP